MPKCIRNRRTTIKKISEKVSPALEIPGKV